MTNPTVHTIAMALLTPAFVKADCDSMQSPHLSRGHWERDRKQTSVPVIQTNPWLFSQVLTHLQI